MSPPDLFSLFDQQINITAECVETTHMYQGMLVREHPENMIRTVGFERWRPSQNGELVLRHKGAAK